MKIPIIPDSSVRDVESSVPSRSLGQCRIGRVRGNVSLNPGVLRDLAHAIEGARLRRKKRPTADGFWPTSPERLAVQSCNCEGGSIRCLTFITDDLKLGDTQFIFTGGVDGRRGWVGDVKNMLLDTAKLKSTGWIPTLDSEQSVALTIREILSKKR